MRDFNYDITITLPSFVSNKCKHRVSTRIILQRISAQVHNTYKYTQQQFVVPHCRISVHLKFILVTQCLARLHMPVYHIWLHILY